MNTSEMNFSLAMPRLRRAEGGYANNPNDSGGETYRGIARKFWPQWEGWALIDFSRDDPSFPENIDHESLAPLVREFYKRHFWDPLRLDDVASVSGAIAYELFDTHVNTGKRGWFLQRELNALNRRRRDYPDLTVDGAIGPATLSALTAFLVKRGKVGETVLLAGLNAQLHQHYLDDVEAREKDEDFFYGWILQRIVR